MNYRIPRMLLVAATVAAGASACRRQPPPPVSPSPAVNQDSIDAAERARREAEERAEAARRDSIARANAAREDSIRRANEAMESVRSALTAPIYFEFDSDALGDAARSALDQKLAILQSNDGVRLRIAGHADERGSDEYNLALGQRRAASAKRYLTQRGIADSRIEIISYGEERPAASGSDESAWAQNRRDEFEITAGGDALRAPSGP
ncbi:MAG TPA: peptidoglycan-associated lipoprotein Pal [Gemmatimonadaceae bacterium]|nr:peptidoglycan-associated lipoprotein Pal [Gemmatimonadaceae bacterium]HZO18994.1 peptidoglycan-associated lipoprotein Pal [Gemmatimonadaceae bacterium]